MRVDLVHAGPDLGWLDVIARYDLFDLAYGEDENDFQLEMSLADSKARGHSPIEDGDYVMVPGTEWGGVVDSHGLDTTGDSPVLIRSGRSWHGILAAKVVRPDPGQDYLTVSGDVVDVIASLIERHGLSKVFTTSGERGTTVKSYTFARYVDLYSGLVSMLASVGMRPSIVGGNGFCSLGAVPIVAYDDGFDDNYLKFQMSENTRPVNHLVCLGSGDLKDRVVVDLYMDGSGSVSEKQTFFGVDEVAEVYDYSNAERDELVEKGTEKLQGYWEDARAIDASSGSYDGPTVGDSVSASSVETPMRVNATVSKVTVKIEGDGEPDVSYDVGSVKMI